MQEPRGGQGQKGMAAVTTEGEEFLVGEMKVLQPPAVLGCSLSLKLSLKIKQHSQLCVNC